MKRNDQEIQGGDNSQNYQANGDINVNGLTYEQVEKLFMTMFKANFYDLQEEAKEVAEKRAEEITLKYINKLSEETIDVLDNTRDPDIRFDIYEVQKAYARSGDKGLSEILIALLVERTKNNDNDLVKIVYNEALMSVSKLTNRQIHLMTLMFITKNLHFDYNSVIQLEDFYNIFLKHFLPNKNSVALKIEDVNYNHINFTGCSSYTNMQFDFRETLRRKFFNKFSEMEITEFIQAHEELERFDALWTVSKIKQYELTSVGIVIAVSNLEKILGKNIDAKIWLEN